MKRFVCALCALLLTLCLAQAEEGGAAAIFQGMLDRIVFPLPSGGTVFYESDYPGMFEDVRQIYGSTKEGEYTLRTADISGWISGMMAHYPDMDAYRVRANTLIQFAAMIPMSYGAQPENMKAHDGGEVITASFTFAYPDMPEVPNEGRAWLNTATGRAVALYGTACEELEEAFAGMRFATEEEQAAWDSREPETVSMGRLAVTFPIPPVRQQVGDSLVTGCLTDRFEYMAVQVFEGTVLRVPGEDGEAREMMEQAAEYAILPTIEGVQITASELTRPAEGVTVLTFNCADPQYGDFATVYRCALCAAPDAVYYVWSMDSEAGRAFLDSFVWQAGV